MGKTAIVTKSNGSNKFCIIRKKRGKLNFKMNDEEYSFYLVEPDDEVASDTYFRTGGHIYAIGANVPSIMEFSNSLTTGKNYSEVFYLENGSLIEITALRNTASVYYDLIRAETLMYNETGGFFFLMKAKRGYAGSSEGYYYFSYGGKNWTTAQTFVSKLVWDYSTWNLNVTYSGFIQYGEKIIFIGKWEQYAAGSDHTLIGIGVIDGYGSAVSWLNQQYYFNIGASSSVGFIQDVVSFGNTAYFNCHGLHFGIDLDTYKITRLGASGDFYGYDTKSNLVYIIDGAKVYYTIDKDFNITKYTKNFEDPMPDIIIVYMGKMEVHKDHIVLDGEKYFSELGFDDYKYFLRSVIYDLPTGYYYFITSDAGYLRRTKDFVNIETVTTIKAGGYKKWLSINAYSKPYIATS